MKKTIIYLFTLLLGTFAFYSCEDPYAGQEVASPTLYEQEALQDANFKATVLTNPLVISQDKLGSMFSFIKVDSRPTLIDSAAHIEYKVILSNTEDFATYKFLPVTYGGASGSDLVANYTNANDTLKALNPSLTAHPAYARVLAYIVSGGTRALYTTATMPFTVTSYNFPPVAVNDTVTAIKDVVLTYNVLANDSDPEGDQLTLVGVGSAANGTVDFAGSSVIYTPNAGFVGNDVFTYTVSDGNSSSTAKVVVTVTAMMQYFETKVNPWFIVGLGGKWNNSLAGLGSDLIPLSVVSGYKYNEAGDGEFVYTGFFSASTSFKLINIPGNWDIQWGNSGGEGINKPVKNDGGSSNFKVPADGYYTITLNSVNNTLTIVTAATVPTHNYTATPLEMRGGWDTNWNVPIAMTQNSNNPHTWYVSHTFAANYEGKFKLSTTWDVNWGDSHFPIGLGVNNGPNIPISAGSYVVIINDLDGCYYFFPVTP